MLRRATWWFVLAVAMFGFTGTAAAKTIVVDDDGGSCKKPDFSKIQDGVDAADPGDTVLVCRGIYREQVEITEDRIRLVAAVFRKVTIKAPSSTLSDPKSLVYVNGASGVQVRNFRIAGPGPGGNDSLQHGVLVEKNENEQPALISGNLITDMRDTEENANFEGIGVRVGRDFAGTAGLAKVARNLIVHYQKGGVVVDGEDSFAQVWSNRIEGASLKTEADGIPPPAQQGVQVGRGASAVVTDNNIANNHYFDTTQAVSFGILVFDTTAKTVFARNRVTDNDIGIILANVQNAVLSRNRVFGNNDSGQGNVGQGIVVQEQGFLGTGPGGPNLLSRNDARGNDGTDCFDDTTGALTAGTANTWKGNRGAEDDPDGICKP